MLEKIAGGKCKRVTQEEMQEENEVQNVGTKCRGKCKRVTQEEMQEETEVQNVGTKSRRKVQEGNTGRNARRE